MSIVTKGLGSPLLITRGYGTLEVGITGQGTVDLPALIVESYASVESLDRSASADITLPALSVDSSATVYPVTTCIADLALPSLTLSATLFHNPRCTTDIELPRPPFDVSGSRGVFSLGSIDLPSLVAAAFRGDTDGVVSALLPALTCGAQRSEFAWSDITLPKITVSGTRNISCTASLIIYAEVSATGHVVVGVVCNTGEGISLPSLQASGSRSDLPASGTVEWIQFRVEGSRGVFGEGLVRLPSLITAGSGTVHIFSNAGITLPLPTVAGRRGEFGTASITLPEFEAIGQRSITATADIVLPVLEVESKTDGFIKEVYRFESLLTRRATWPTKLLYSLRQPAEIW